MLRLELGGGCQLLDRRRTAELQLEFPGHPPQLVQALLHVHRDADRPALVRDRALEGLADPPRAVGRELVALTPVELLDGAVEADRPFLNQVEKRHAPAAVAVCERDDEPQVRVHHQLLRGAVAALDPLGEHDLLVRAQKRVAADLLHEELERLRAVRGRRGQVEVDGILVFVGIDDLNAARLELEPELLELRFVQFVLDSERGERGLVHRTALFGLLQEALQVAIIQYCGHISSFVNSGYDGGERRGHASDARGETPISDAACLVRRAAVSSRLPVGDGVRLTHLRHLSDVP